MPNINPWTVGDVVYPQYSVTETMELHGGVAGVKGKIYTTG